MPFPEEIISFPVMMDIDPTTDAELINQYQTAIQNNDIIRANEILNQITNVDKKIITAQYLNLITSTVVALQNYYLQKYSPNIVVSATQPPLQENTDFWFEITGTE